MKKEELEALVETLREQIEGYERELTRLLEMGIVYLTRYRGATLLKAGVT